MRQRKKKAILKKFVKKISKQKDMPSKYQKLASKHFWDLI
jgi:hypothetical protein